MSVPNNPSQPISIDSKHKADTKAAASASFSAPTATTASILIEPVADSKPSATASPAPAKPTEPQKCKFPSQTEARDAVYGLYEELYGLKIEDLDRKNRAALEDRLRNFTGVSEEMQAFLKAKLASAANMTKSSDTSSQKPNMTASLAQSGI